MMNNIENIKSRIPIPIYVFSEVDIDSKEVSDRFVTGDLNSLFECIRQHMSLMGSAVAGGQLLSFNFETRMLSPRDIETIIKEIKEKNAERLGTSLPPAPLEPEIPEPPELELLEGEGTTTNDDKNQKTATRKNFLYLVPDKT